MMYDWGYGNGYGVWDFIFMVLMMVLVVVSVVVAIRYLARGTGNYQGDTALELLKKRYAKGEIDKQEFEEKRKGLGK
jgi:putative membrane protein